MDAAQNDLGVLGAAVILIDRVNVLAEAIELGQQPPGDLGRDCVGDWPVRQEARQPILFVQHLVGRDLVAVAIGDHAARA